MRRRRAPVQRRETAHRHGAEEGNRAPLLGLNEIVEARERFNWKRAVVAAEVKKCRSIELESAALRM